MFLSGSSRAKRSRLAATTLQRQGGGHPSTPSSRVSAQAIRTVSHIGSMLSSSVRGKTASAGGLEIVRSSRQTKTAARLLLAQVLEGNIELVAHLITHHAADADPAWLGQGFEPCRDIDPVSEDVLALDNDIAKIDPELGTRYAPLARWPHFAPPCPAEPRQRSAPLDHAYELDKQPVGGGLDDAAARRA